MFQIVVQHTQQGAPALKLHTEKRNLARAIALLGKENKVEVKVVVEVAPREVKFRELG